MPSAEVVLPCDDLDAAIAWFEQIGFRLHLITPADAPRVAVLEGHGLFIRLDRAVSSAAATLRVPTEGQVEPVAMTAPNGTIVELVPMRSNGESSARRLPPNDPAFVLSRYADASFGTGRAGMQYRDLLPGRQRGHYIASHICIPWGGPVPDYVHHHHIVFQMIFCHAGWADLVYEGQGEPFRMEAGDCVLQPPHIRHRVLHTSDEFEVVEISSPAEHDTLRDHDLVLPTTELYRDRDFGGQRFVWHRAREAAWTDWDHPGFVQADFGIGAATDGLAHVASVRTTSGDAIDRFTSERAFRFWFVRSGSAVVESADGSYELGPRDAVAFAWDEEYALSAVSSDFEVLDVAVGSSGK